MSRHFLSLFISAVVIALGWIGYLRIQEKLQSIELTHCESPQVAELKQPGEFPVPETYENPVDELKIIKICEGQTSRDLLDESGEKYSTAVPRTILFFNGGRHIPDIITARITSSQSSRDYGVAFEHGALNDLRAIQSPEFGSRLDSLMVEAADLCLGAYSDYRQYEVDFAALREEIESNATAYLALDFDIHSPETQVVLYYKLGAEIFQRDLSKLLNPI